MTRRCDAYRPSVRQRYALAAEVTKINRHLSALRSDLEVLSPDPSYTGFEASRLVQVYGMQPAI